MHFRKLLPILLLVMGMPALFANVIATHAKSVAAKNAGRMEEFYQLNLQMVEEGQAENLPHYAYIGTHNAAYVSYREHRMDDCLSQATLGIALFKEHGESRNFSQKWFADTHTGLWGLTERCHSRQMRPGEGWKAQQKATMLWHQAVGLAYTAGKFDIAAMSKLKPKDLTNGLRHVGREASYLHDFGKTAEARALLQAAIELDKKNRSAPSSYGMQLVSTLAVIDSFIGYKESAIELATEQIRQTETFQRKSARSGLSAAKLNLIRNKADFEGASEALLAEARALVALATKSESKRSASYQRVLTALENQLRNSSKGAAELEEIAQEALRSGEDLDAFYLERNALFLRSETSGENLDSHFNQLLTETRRTGLKRSEPRVYRRYGDWLTREGRFGEAITVYREALTLSKTFGWHPMIPRLYGRLGLTYQKAGQEAAADAIWRESDDYVSAHPEIPVQSILKGWEFRLLAYLAAGRETEVQALVEQARSQDYEGGLKPYWLKFFTDESIAQYRKSFAEQAPPEPSAGLAVAGLQPTSLSTVALPGTSGSGVFYLVNPGATALSGTLSFTGLGAATSLGDKDEEPSFSGDLSKPNGVVQVPLTLMGGRLKSIPVTLPSDQEGESTFTLTWTPSTGEPIRSTWTCAWGAQISEAVVLESADLKATPFIGVPVIHHVGFPEGDLDPSSIRAKGATPLRIEYRDPDSGELLAIDADGNGDFTGEGEFAISTTSLTAPEVQPISGARSAKIEIWLYPTPGNPWTEDIELTIELHRGESWEAFATDLLKTGGR